MLVNETVIVELKAVESLAPIHQAQLLTYLKLSGKRIGLLINFNTVHLRDGIKRMVNG
jgi:GxxExxY protein